ncbi:hypothetical protein F0562_025184 [Nyssa sinensis]|uniref:Cytochrome P450 n=1 Tax=Nyssa sinensis TaxID=561372 RepID=A0A5J5BEQ3_9ASTE|nr:hypothetical protein F0562_025184 [Nyssa sinensis]
MEAAKAHEVVDVSEKVAGLIEDMTYRMLFGRNKDDRFDLKSIVHQALSLVAAPNLADYVPFLGAFDLQGLTRHFKETGKALDKILEIIIEEHVQEANSRQQRNNHEMDFVDVMLSLMKKSTNTHDELSSIIDRTRLLNIRLVVAQLVHCFHWELPNGMSTAEMDMTEKFDLSSPRAKHLLAVPKYCLGVQDF